MSEIKNRFPALKNTSIKMLALGESSMHSIGSCWKRDKEGLNNEDLVLLSNIYNMNKRSLFLNLSSTKLYYLIPSKLIKLNSYQSIDSIIGKLEMSVQDNGDLELMIWLANIFCHGAQETRPNYKKYLCYSLAAARKNPEQFGDNVDVLLDDFLFLSEELGVKEYNDSLRFLNKYIREYDIPRLYNYIDPDINGNWSELLLIAKYITKEGRIKKGIKPFIRKMPPVPKEPLTCYYCNEHFLINEDNNPERVRYYWNILGTPINIDINNKNHIFCSKDCESRYQYFVSSIEIEIEDASVGFINYPELEEDDEYMINYRESLEFLDFNTNTQC